MTPVSFNDCFGWLHAPAPGAASGDVGVVVCQGLMRDGLLAHCSFRLLGDELAASGMPMLRFDYPGTGDSLDAAVAAEGSHWDAWLKSIDQAAEWLKATTGVKRLVFCGLRAGAMLATVAAGKRSDVAGLLLFQPVVSGRTYVREMILEADLQSGKTSARGEDLDIREFVFSAATLEQISAVDLRKVVLPAGLKAALFVRPDARQIEECVAAWKEKGVEAEHQGWDGLVPLMRHNVIDENALADFAHVHAWLKRAIRVEPTVAGPSPPEMKLTPDGAIETPFWFGPKLFGVLSRPASGTPGASGDQILLIGNGGRDPHYGAARQNVDFARHLAKNGIACLRFDFAGLGDSIGPPGKENLLTHTFTDRLPDIRAALDSLATQGFRRFAMLGLCSGAYHAFHAALADPRLSRLLLVNLPLFQLPTRNVLDFLENRGTSATIVGRKLFNIGSWKTLLSGRSNVRTLVRSVINHARRVIVGKSQAIGRRLGLIRDKSFPEQALTKLSRQGTRALFLFSPGDEEIDAFAREFGPAGEKLAPYMGSRLLVLPRMDHDLTKAIGRRDAEQAVTDFLKAP